MEPNQSQFNLPKPPPPSKPAPNRPFVNNVRPIPQGSKPLTPKTPFIEAPKPPAMGSGMGGGIGGAMGSGSSFGHVK